MSQLATILPCPSCAAIIRFEHAAGTIKACSSCGKIVERKNNQLSIAEGLNAVTVQSHHIQLGTTGKWNERTFTVLGKMGVWFEEAFFSYWCIVFNNDQVGYLAEDCTRYYYQKK